MQRYFIQPEQLSGQEAAITGDDAHHLVRVMRAKPGDRIIVCDGVGRAALAEVTDTGKAAVAARILEWLPTTNEPQLQVTLAQSLPKGDKLETVIQKNTEIGAVRFVPFLSERTVVQYDERKEAKRLERWRKIAKEAAEQSHRSRVPAVDPPCSWRQLLQLASEADLALLCYEREEQLSFKAAIRRAIAERAGRVERAERAQGAARAEGAERAQGASRSEGAERAGAEPAEPAGRADGAAVTSVAAGMRVLLIVGPEGGFSEREAAEAAAAGCVPVRLGARILRTETAGTVGLTCLLYETGEMGE